ncbi:MAG: sn-glycerol-3-phosphate ABC transporter ATP-binding protein UgpC [Hyphomicrobium sp.]|nr:sn-glycerol-3-phosphate ABC transporter ATP-binding protein UgpC [Hyphomicrobium sp.]
MSYLELDHLAKRFGDIAVVHDMHLSAAAGEFVVLVGASGCGKSTTLRMIAGLESVSDGAIRIDGRDVTHATPAARDIAMVFQNYALYPHMTVAGNMGFALSMAGVDGAAIERRVEVAAKVLGIEALLARKPRELSGGQRQRVAMGRAIVREPKVFLFDEPLSNLDAKLRGQVRIEIAQLHRRLGKTTVYVTHDQVEAMTLADRIVVMDRGIVQQMGSPDEIFNRPVNQFVAGFIGSPPMNFVAVLVQPRADVPHFVSAAATLPVPAPMRERVAALAEPLAVLGVRPQSVRADVESRPGDLLLPARVEVCEYLGTETQLVCSLRAEGAQRITASLPGNQRRAIGSEVVLSVAPDDLHAFAPGGHGASLTAPLLH